MRKLHAGSNSSVTLVSVKKVAFDPELQVLKGLERQSIVTQVYLKLKVVLLEMVA